jgi:hypothetical protein
MIGGNAARRALLVARKQTVLTGIYVFVCGRNERSAQPLRCRPHWTYKQPETEGENGNSR